MEDQRELDRERVGAVILQDAARDCRLLADQAIEQLLDEQVDGEDDREVVVLPLETAHQPCGCVGHGRGAEDSISVNKSRRSSCQGPLP